MYKVCDELQITELKLCVGLSLELQFLIPFVTCYQGKFIPLNSNELETNLAFESWLMYSPVMNTHYKTTFAPFYKENLMSIFLWISTY